MWGYLSLLNPHHMNESAVFRHLAIPVSVFDRIKQFQRSREAATGDRLTLNQTISAIVREAPQDHPRMDPQRLPALGEKAGWT